MLSTKLASLLNKFLPQSMKKAKLHPNMLKLEARQALWVATVELETLLDCKLEGLSNAT